MKDQTSKQSLKSCLQCLRCFRDVTSLCKSSCFHENAWKLKWKWKAKPLYIVILKNLTVPCVFLLDTPWLKEALYHISIGSWHRLSVLRSKLLSITKENGSRIISENSFCHLLSFVQWNLVLVALKNLEILIRSWDDSCWKRSQEVIFQPHAPSRVR